jgi:hypothetical protein
MTVAELCARFPEIPVDLRDDPVLARFAGTLGDLLEQARKPSPCSTEHDAANHFYLKLVGPIAVYGYGLSTRDKLVAQLEEMLDRHDADPSRFVGSLLPSGTAGREVKGPGCS